MCKRILELIAELERKDRGTGRTTKQILAAPQGAVFVWTNAYLSYPKHLAFSLGRQDLLIVPPLWLEHPGGYIGRKLTGLVLDHAAGLTTAQWRGWEEVHMRIETDKLINEKEPCR